MRSKANNLTTVIWKGFQRLQLRIKVISIWRTVKMGWETSCTSQQRPRSASHQDRETCRCKKFDGQLSTTKISGQRLLPSLPPVTIRCSQRTTTLPLIIVRGLSVHQPPNLPPQLWVIPHRRGDGLVLDTKQCRPTMHDPQPGRQCDAEMQ